MSTSKHISACIKRLMKPRTGVHSIARRIAPGKKFRKETVAAVTKYVALSGLAHHATCFLGRCPKLLNLAPSGLLRQLLMNADNIRARAVVQIFDGRATRESSGEEACALRAAVLHLPAPARVSFLRPRASRKVSRFSLPSPAWKIRRRTTGQRRQIQPARGVCQATRAGGGCS